MKRPAPFGIFAAVAVYYALGLGTLPLMDRDEPRFAESAREMLERHDWIVPHFNGVPRYDKPPLVYWLQAAAYRVCGQNDFAARLPSALAVAGTAALIFAFARRLYGTRTALVSAAVFALAAQTFFLAKAAVADPVMTFFFTAAVWAAWELLSDPPGGPRSAVRAAVLYASIALGFLTKGPVALLPLVAACVFALWTRVPDAARRLKIWPGLLSASVFVALWAVPALVLTKGEYAAVGLGHHVIDRSLRPLEGHGPGGVLTYCAMLPFYFVTIFVSFLPWSPFLPPAVRYYGQTQNRGVRERFLMAVAGTVFAVFTPLATKLPHYTFPALPVLAILTARYAERTGKSVLIQKICVVSVSAAVIFNLAVLPLVAPFFPARALYVQSRADIPRNAEFASFGFNEPSLVWYFRHSISGSYTSLPGHEIAAFMARPGARFCVLPQKNAAEFFPQPDPSWRTFTASGIDPAKGKQVELVMYLKKV